MRGLITQTDIPRVFDILLRREVSVNGGMEQALPRIYGKDQDQINLQLAEVLRDLTVLKGDKELSFGERKIWIRHERCFSKNSPLSRTSLKTKSNSLFAIC